MTFGGIFLTVYDPSELRGRTCRWMRSSTNLMPKTEIIRSMLRRNKGKFEQHLCPYIFPYLNPIKRS